jgi:hypothetical protein
MLAAQNMSNSCYRLIKTPPKEHLRLLRHAYLKRFGNDTFAAITDNQKALTWYKADYPDALFQDRKDILTHKKNAGTESGT